jgi:hypothetical protein
LIVPLDSEEEQEGSFQGKKEEEQEDWNCNNYHFLIYCNELTFHFS